MALLWLGLLSLASLASAVRPKPWSSLQLEVKGRDKVQYGGRGGGGWNGGWNNDDDDYKTTTTAAPTTTPLGSNGFPLLTSSTKRKIETCVIDSFMADEFACQNNAYAGLARLCFHDCATSDQTQNTTYLRAGCGAWMTKQCNSANGEVCEWNNPDNAGLQMWVTPLNAAYDSAKVDGKNLNQYLSRTDFWQLACNRAIRSASGWAIAPDFYAGRSDQPYPQPGPSFPGRLPQAHSAADYKALCGRNFFPPNQCVALLTAHSLGQAHPTATGYRGAFDSSPTVLDNQFWKGLWSLQWFSQSVDSVDGNGVPRTKLQFALSYPNDKVSLMLPSDINVLWDIDANSCDWEVDPWALVNKQCPLLQPPNFTTLVKSWVDSNSQALNDFSDSWEVMSQWGCTNCYIVPHTSDSSFCLPYSHTCKRGYTESPAYWKPGWYTPGPGPSKVPVTQLPAGSTTTKVPYGQTTKAPSPTPSTQCATSTKTPYGQTTTTRAPSTTTAPTTTTTTAPATTTKTPYGQTTTTRPPTTTPQTTTPSPTPSTTTPTPVPTTTPGTTIIVTITRDHDTSSPIPTTTTTAAPSTTILVTSTTPLPTTTTTEIPTTTPVPTTTPTEIPTTTPIETTTTEIPTTTPVPTTTTTEAPTTTTTTPVPTTTTTTPVPTTTTTTPVPTTTTTPVPTTTTTTPVPTTTTTQAPTTTSYYGGDTTTTPVPTTTTTTPVPTTTTTTPVPTTTTTTPVPTTTTTTPVPTTTTTTAPTTTHKSYAYIQRG